MFGLKTEPYFLHKEKSFTITIIPFTALPNYADQFDCNSYTLPADTNGGIYYSGTNKDYLFLHQAPLLQALNQYLFIKKRQQYH
jgi:hypothetical protein